MRFILYLKNREKKSWWMEYIETFFVSCTPATTFVNCVSKSKNQTSFFFLSEKISRIKKNKFISFIRKLKKRKKNKILQKIHAFYLDFFVCMYVVPMMRLKYAEKHHLLCIFTKRIRNLWTQIKPFQYLLRLNAKRNTCTPPLLTFSHATLKNCINKIFKSIKQALNKAKWKYKGK